MRIGAVSDIHVDINSKRRDNDFSLHLIDYLNSLSLDILIIPGDVAGSVNSIIDFFDKCRSIENTLKIYVPGNHDIWAGSAVEDGSWIKYREVLPLVCKETGWHYLPGNPLKIEDTVFFGSMGWYDYSTINPMWEKTYTLSDYKRKVNPNNVKWMDAEYAKFGMDDPDVAEILLGELHSDIKSAGFIETSIPDTESSTGYEYPGNDISSLVMVSHMVPYMDFIDFRNEPSWDFFGAYIGNKNIGKMFDSISGNLKRYAFFGHTHFPAVKKLNTGVEGYCVPLGYPAEYGKGPLDEVFSKRVKVLDTDYSQVK